MYDFSDLLVTVLIALVVGIGVGALLARRFTLDGRKQREMEQNVNKLLQQQKDYQHEVAMHFTDTARLLNNLAESYRDVHNHLASGASELCADDAGNILRQIPDAGLSQITAAPEPEAVNPPLDYAPKGSPYATGVLNEEFGLDKQSAEAPDAASIVDAAPLEEEAEDIKKPT